MSPAVREVGARAGIAAFSRGHSCPRSAVKSLLWPVTSDVRLGRFLARVLSRNRYRHQHFDPRYKTTTPIGAPCAVDADRNNEVVRAVFLCVSFRIEGSIKATRERAIAWTRSIGIYFNIFRS